MQVAPQLIGPPVTVPLPVPARMTVSGNVSSVNVAVTLLAMSIVTVHGPVPVHAPLQPANVEPVDAAGGGIRAVLSWTGRVHAGPRAMPAGVDVTEPLPVPARVTASGNVCSVNVAVTVV